MLESVLLYTKYFTIVIKIPSIKPKKVKIIKIMNLQGSDFSSITAGGSIKS